MNKKLKLKQFTRHMQSEALKKVVSDAFKPRRYLPFEVFAGVAIVIDAEKGRANESS